MIYREPRRRSQSELEVDFCAVSPEVVSAALVDSAHFNEADWVLAHLLEAVDDPRSEVVRAALVSLAALARRGEMPTDRRIWRSVLRLLDQSDYVGLAEDALDDFEVFGTRGARDRTA